MAIYVHVYEELNVVVNNDEGSVYKDRPHAQCGKGILAESVREKLSVTTLLFIRIMTT